MDVNGRITVENRGTSNYVAIVHDYATGSSTSVGGETRYEVINEALTWLGVEVKVLGE